MLIQKDVIRFASQSLDRCVGLIDFTVSAAVYTSDLSSFFTPQITTLSFFPWNAFQINFLLNWDATSMGCINLVIKKDVLATWEKVVSPLWKSSIRHRAKANSLRRPWWEVCITSYLGVPVPSSLSTNSICWNISLNGTWFKIWNVWNKPCYCQWFEN